MTCSHCGDDAALRFRLYKRVVGCLIFDRVHYAAGYFCRDCRRRLVIRHLLLTGLLGWWGVIALYFRNPIAILVNLWAIFAPPFSPQDYGAVHAATLIDAAREWEEQTEPSPSSTDPELTPAEITLITAGANYYDLLQVGPTATSEAVRTAHRALLKVHHPDVAGDAGHEATVAINQAYEVIGNDRLRAAYDQWRTAAPRH